VHGETPARGRRERSNFQAKERKQFFFEKKNKKLLSIWRSGAPEVVRTRITDKSFLVLFFKKELLS
jgi:hypothetical protein